MWMTFFSTKIPTTMAASSTRTDDQHSILLGGSPTMNENESMEQQDEHMIGSRLRPPHPTARAFFEALDVTTKSKQSTSKTPTTKNTTTNDGDIDSFTSESNASNETSTRVHDEPLMNTGSAPSTSSAWIHKRMQTLGWRNRYSQADQYPIQMECNNEQNSFTVRQVQRGEVEGTYGTGATVWPASLVLLYYLQQLQQRQRRQQEHEQACNNNTANDDSNDNSVIVELGAGTGVVSIAAALLFGGRLSSSLTKIVCTDGCEPVVDLARDNIQQAAQQLVRSEHPSLQQRHVDANITCSSSSSSVVATIHGCPIYVKHYWWGNKPLPTDNDDDLSDMSHQEHQKDPVSTTTTRTRTIVLVSDCVLPKLYPIAPLVEALDQLLSRDCRRRHDDDDDDDNNDVAYISYEHRYYPDYDPRDKFRELCQEKGLQVILIPLEEQHPIYSVDDIELWKVQRNP